MTAVPPVGEHLSPEERHRSFLALTSEGIWRAAAIPPIPIALPVEEQVRRILRDGVLVECNDAMARMYGAKSGAELGGIKMGQFIVESDPQNQDYLGAFVRHGYRLEGHESVERAIDGTHRIFLNSLVGIVRDGMLIEAWGSQVDITARTRAEAEVRQAQALDAVSRLAGSVAHDFNNLLTTILTSVELLLDQFAPDAPAREDAEEIRRSARRGAELTRQLLALSRQQVLAPRPIDVHALVRRVEQDIRNAFAPSAKVDFTFGDGPGIAHVDVEELEQMLVHLATHAAEVIGEGGAFALDVRREKVAEARAALPDQIMPGDYVAIRLQHSGVQLGAHSAPSLLEPFAGMEMPSLGSGLALATMYGFVRQSGGAVILEPVATGVSLTIYFPATALPTPAMPSHLASDRSGRRTVLLAEDEPTVRLMMKRVLERAGFSVMQASNGEEALELARAYDSTIDVLVTDVIMPGMGGGELSRVLRRERPGLRILHVSGYTAGALRHHDVLQEGAAFLQKPFSPQTFLAKLQEVLV
ncbi:MAG TPA: response regulator [Gemmatimonadaceae bacterium]|nr:response regulator [Gemmatimonadaceae bacterium]